MTLSTSWGFGPDGKLGSSSLILGPGAAWKKQEKSRDCESLSYKMDSLGTGATLHLAR